MCSPVRDGEEVAADMLAPATKRLCSSVGTIVKRVAIEGNIGNLQIPSSSSSKYAPPPPPHVVCWWYVT